MDKSWVSYTANEGFENVSDTDSSKSVSNNVTTLVDYSSSSSDDSSVSSLDGEDIVDEVPESYEVVSEGTVSSDSESEEELPEQLEAEEEPIVIKATLNNYNSTFVSLVLAASLAAACVVGVNMMSTTKEISDKIDDRIDKLSNSVEETTEILQLFYTLVSCKVNGSSV